MININITNVDILALISMDFKDAERLGLCSLRHAVIANMLDKLDTLDRIPVPPTYTSDTPVKDCPPLNEEEKSMIDSSCTGKTFIYAVKRYRERNTWSTLRQAKFKCDEYKQSKLND